MPAESAAAAAIDQAMLAASFRLPDSMKVCVHTTSTRYGEAKVYRANSHDSKSNGQPTAAKLDKILGQEDLHSTVMEYQVKPDSIEIRYVH